MPRSLGGGAAQNTYVRNCVNGALADNLHGERPDGGCSVRAAQSTVPAHTQYDDLFVPAMGRHQTSIERAAQGIIYKIGYGGGSGQGE